MFPPALADTAADLQEDVHFLTQKVWSYYFTTIRLKVQSMMRQVEDILLRDELKTAQAVYPGCFVIAAWPHVIKSSGW